MPTARKTKNRLLGTRNPKTLNPWLVYDNFVIIVAPASDISHVDRLWIPPIWRVHSSRIRACASRTASGVMKVTMSTMEDPLRVTRALRDLAASIEESVRKKEGRE
jgi:hypothetical protein